MNARQTTSWTACLSCLALALLAGCSPPSSSTAPSRTPSASPLVEQLRSLVQPIEALRERLRETLRSASKSSSPDLAALQTEVAGLSQEQQAVKARTTAQIDGVTRQMEQFRSDAAQQLSQGKVDPPAIVDMANLARQYERETTTVSAKLSALQHELEELSSEITRWSNTISAARQLRGEEEAGRLARQLIQQHLDRLDKHAS